MQSSLQVYYIIQNGNEKLLQFLFFLFKWTLILLKNKKYTVLNESPILCFVFLIWNRRVIRDSVSFSNRANNGNNASCCLFVCFFPVQKI